MSLYSINDALGTQDLTDFPQSSFAACCERQLEPVTTFLSLISKARNTILKLKPDATENEIKLHLTHKFYVSLKLSKESC